MQRGSGFLRSVDENGTLHVSWVSYKGTGLLPQNASPSNAAYLMSRNTVVKTTKIRLGGTSTKEDSRVTEIVREWNESEPNGYRFQPVSAGMTLWYSLRHSRTERMIWRAERSV